MKSLKLPQLRLGIFITWVCFAVLLSLLPFGFLLTAHYPREVDTGTARDLALSLSSLWFPALGCLAGYWFGATESAAKPSRKQGAKLVAVILTAVSLSGILFIVCLTLYTHSFRTEEDGSLSGPSLSVKISELISALHYFAPLYYAPITFLTGKAIGNKDSEDIQPSQVLRED